MNATAIQEKIANQPEYREFAKRHLQQFLKQKKKQKFGQLTPNEKSEYFNALDKGYVAKNEMKQEGNVTLDQIVDYEGEMIRQQMAHIQQWAAELQQGLSDQDQLEAWVQDKISKAHLHLQSVYEYLKHQHA